MAQHKFSLEKFIVALEAVFVGQVESQVILFRKIGGISSHVYKALEQGLATEQHYLAIGLVNDLKQTWIKTHSSQKREKINRCFGRIRQLITKKQEDAMANNTKVEEVNATVVTVRYCSACYNDLLPTEKKCRMNCMAELKTREIGNDSPCILASPELATENPHMEKLGAGFVTSAHPAKLPSSLAKEPMRPNSAGCRNEMSVMG